MGRHIRGTHQLPESVVKAMLKEVSVKALAIQTNEFKKLISTQSGSGQAPTLVARIPENPGPSTAVAVKPIPVSAAPDKKQNTVVNSAKQQRFIKKYPAKIIEARNAKPVLRKSVIQRAQSLVVTTDPLATATVQPIETNPNPEPVENQQETEIVTLYPES